ncbi:uncharacterized protein O3C94_004469 [Discoglossus pictus]
MSHGVMRKSQPFTIGTKLSLAKCPDFAVSACDVTALSSCPLPPNLHERVSQYLALTSHPAQDLSPSARGTLHAHNTTGGFSDIDCLNRGSLARSIKKITLSSQIDPAHDQKSMSVTPRMLNLNSMENFNNNNSRTLRSAVPSFIGVTKMCSVRNDYPKDTPDGPRDIGDSNKWMIRNDSPRDTGDPHQLMVRNYSPRTIGDPNKLTVRNDSPRTIGDPSNWTVRSHIPRVIGCPNNQLRINDISGNNGSPNRKILKDDIPRVIGVQCHKTSTSQAKSPGSPSHTDIVRKRLASIGSRMSPADSGSHLGQLSRDITQAEAWVRGKLRDLGDRCDASPLQDWEQGTLTLQSDMKGFESTIMRLTQMGENLTKSQTPSTESIRMQLQTLRDQWQLLKQTATNQSKAMGGAKALQEFNKKADELEMWMRDKEEVPSLAHLLDENCDKVQLTRRILDLKQEQLHYRNLQENINSLAQKLEKQGRTESKGTSTRRKHLNKMWMRLQDSLLDHQQTLQLALEAASLWHQADTILRAIEEKINVTAVTRGECESARDVRDIGSQIMMLDVSVSQVSSLHPVLASRASHKQRQVRESWAQLQLALRTEKSEKPDPSSSFTREQNNPKTPGTEEQSTVGKQQQGILGNEAGATRRENTRPKQDPPGSTGQTGSDVIHMRQTEMKTRRNSLEDRGRVRRGSQAVSCPAAPEASHLLNELGSTERWLESLEDLLAEPTTMRSPEVIRRDLREVAVLEREVKSRGLALHSLRDRVRGTRNSGESMEVEAQGKVLEVEERFRTVQDVLQRRASDLRDSLVLSEFMKIVQIEEEKRNKEMLRSGSPVRDGPRDAGLEGELREIFTPLEELQEAVEMLNEAVKERERVVAMSKETDKLENVLSSVSQMVSQVRTHLDDLVMETERVEQSYSAVRCQEDLRDLQGLVTQQQQLQVHISGTLRLEVRRLEEQAERLQDLSPERTEEIQDINQTWAELQEKVQENQTRLQRATQLRGFFKNYLEMISWTEHTRAQIFSDSPGESVPTARREELERRIDGKLREFEELASIGWKFIGDEHFLTQTIRERLEELQGMLSWVLMRWRCQKQQSIMGKRTERRKAKDVPPESYHVMKDSLSTNDHQVTSCIPPEAFETTPGTAPPVRGPTLRRYERQAHSPMSMHTHLSLLALDKESKARAEPPEGPQRARCGEGPVWLQPREPPAGAEKEEPQEALYTPPLLKPPDTPTFWKRCQGLLGNTFNSLKRRKRVSLSNVEEVSTYLHVNDSENTQPKACQSLTLPRPSKKAQPQDRYSLPSNSGTGAQTSTFPKIRPRSLFSSLKRKEKAQRRTVQGIMGLYGDELQSNLEDIKKCQTHTWPPKQHRKVSVRSSSPDFGKLLNYVKNPLARDIDAECAASEPILKKDDFSSKSLHLGTPRIASNCRHLMLGSVLNVELPKDVSLLGDIEKKITVVSKEPNSREEPGEDLSLINRMGSQGRVDQSIIIDPVGQQHNQPINQEPHSHGCKSWIEELARSPGYCRQNLHAYGRPVCGPNSKQLDRSHEDFISLEIDRLSPTGIPTEPDHYRSDTVNEPQRLNGTIVKTMSTNVQCHSRYQSGNIIYFSPREVLHCVSASSTAQDDGNNGINSTHGSSIALIKTDNGPSSQLSELSLCKNPPPYSAQKNPLEDRVVRKAGSASLPEVLHPDHEFLEQDDEELEGIWNNAKRGNDGDTTQIPHSHTTLHKVGENGNMVKTVPTESANQKAPILMVSKPNILVATYRLPTSAPLAERQRGIQMPEQENRYNKTNGESHSRIHHQKASETGTLVSSHQNPTESIREDEAKGKKQTSATKIPRKLDFQLMEGPLEKKHIMQQGGRKALCRTWSMYHAVLVRRTLCFYQDRKYSKSTVSAPPLHLNGAVCTPETDYTKRDNCLHLRLLDGSEYLLRAPSSALVQEWLSKLQHNSGLEDTDPLGGPSLGAGVALSLTRGVLRHQVPDTCQPIPLQDRAKPERNPQGQEDQKEPTHSRTSEQPDGGRVTICPSRSKLSYLMSVESSRASGGCSQDEDLSLVANRRSRSFSSVTYQQITSSSRPQKMAPSYSVTLYINDPPAPRVRSHSFAAGLEVSHQAGDPKPRNKSVFRKFFRKKD